MSAPTHEKSATEQPTQPLPITHEYPRGLRSDAWIPGTIVTAIGTGWLIRSYVLVTDVARSNFAIVALLAIFAISLGVFLCARRASSEDTGAISLSRED